MNFKNSGAFAGSGDAGTSKFDLPDRTQCGSVSPAPEPSAAEGAPDARVPRLFRPRLSRPRLSRPRLSRLRRIAAAALLALVACLALPQAASATAPTVSSAEVTAAKPKELVVTFSEALATGSVPAAAAFAVKVGGSAGPAVSSVAIDSGDATKLKLGLAVALDAGQTSVTVDYTKPGSNPLKDGDDNEVATFTNQSVTNNAPACPAGQPSAAFWTACLTIGKWQAAQFGGAAIYGFTLDRGGALSDEDFAYEGENFDVTTLGGVGEVFVLSFGGSNPATGRFVLQVGATTLSFDGGVRTKFWHLPAALAWTDANVGDKVSVSLRQVAAPQTRSIGGRVVRAGLPFLYVLRNGTFGDPAGAGLTYSAAQLDGSPLPDWLTFDPRRRTLRGTPTNADATGPDERIFVAFTATDGNGGKQLAALRIGVVPDEDPPVLRSVKKGARTLALAYSEPLDEDSTPGVGAFTVIHGNTLTEIPVSSVDVTGRNVVLTLATAISGVASVGYTVPTGANAMPIRDVAGTDAAEFDETVEDFTVSVRALQPRVSEGAESAGFEISLDPVPTDPNVAFFVHWETVPGTAVPHWKSQTGADYTGTGGTYALGNNSLNKPTYRVWVPLNDDGLDEGSETFGLRIGLGFGPEQTDIVSPTSAPQYVKDLAVRIDRAEAQVTIEDNDSGPSVTLRAPGGRIGDDIREGDEEASFGVWLLPGTGSVSYPVTVNYAVRALTAAEADEAGGRVRATAGVDFATGTGTVTFNAGETYKTVSLDVPRTPELEGDEYFAVELSSPSGARIDESLGLYMIFDNPGPYKSRIGVQSGAPPESDGGGCGVNLSVEFRDGNGDRTQVSSLAATDFAVENGRIGTPVADADGLRWTVPAWSTAGFTGLMRVKLPAKAPDPEGRATAWEAAEQVLRVAGDNDCTAVARNTLAALALEGPDLDPAFDAGTTAYTAAAPADTDMVTVTASAVYGTSDVAIAPADADTEAEGHQVALAAGGTGIAVTVTPADGSAAQTWTVAVTGASDPGVLTGFVLVDASNDADLGAVESGGTVSASADGSYGIRAEVKANAEVGSVVLSLAGPGETDTHTRTENIAPYSLYGDAPGGANGRAEHGRALAAGSYTLTATAYAARGGAGDVLGTLTVPFTVAVAAPPPPPAGVLTGLVLLDASDQSTVATLSNGAAIDLGGSSGGSFAIRADVAADTTVGSVALSLSGAKTVSATENIAPYSLYGDRGDGAGGRALDGGTLPAGSYTLSATAYAGRGASGTVLGSRSVSFQVLAPAALSVADARAEEGPGATLDFAVTLDRSSTGTVTVEYATSDGTATAGSDYTATSGTLTFAPGETEKTVSVPILADDHDEGSETLTLRLSNAQGARIADGEATGTITNDGAIPEAWLARFGRTVTGQVLDAVAARLDAPRTAGAQANLAGQALPSWRPGPGARPGSGSGTNSGSGSGASDGSGPERLSAADVQGRDAMETIRSWMADTGAGRRDAGAAGGADGLRFESRALTPRDFLTGSSFALTVLTGGAKKGGYASLWGRGAIAGFDGREGDLSLDGEVTTGLIGADWASSPESGVGRWIAGLAIGHSTGTGGWRRGGCTEGNCGGGIEATLTGLYPYAGIDLTDRLSVWAAAGYGAGEVTVTPDGGPGLTADLTMAMGAAGLRSNVLRPEDGDGLSLDFKGDARFTRTASDAVRSGDGNLEAAEADVWLIRAGVEGSRRFALGNGTDGGASLTPSFEAGLRLDGGAAESGFGADLGGGLAFADPESGLRLDLKGRVLIAHSSAGFKEWGASGALAWDPRPTTDRGLSLSLRQSWGAAPAGGMDALLSRETLAGLAANDNPGSGAGAGGRFEASSRLEAEIGYGLPMFGGAFTGTPNIGFGLSGGGGRDWRIGWRLTSAVSGDPGFEVNLDANRHEPANDEEPEHAVMLRGAIRF